MSDQLADQLAHEQPSLRGKAVFVTGTGTGTVTVTVMTMLPRLSHAMHAELPPPRSAVAEIAMLPLQESSWP